MSAPKNTTARTASQPASLTYFDVSDYRTITVPGVCMPTVRSDVFPDVAPDRIRTTTQLIDEIDGCTPLASYFSDLADERLSEIQEELEDGSNPLGRTERRRLTLLAAQLRTDPESGWQDWIRHEGDPGLASFKELIQDWLDDAIDWNESDWFDSSWSGQSSALQYFSSLHHDVCEALGIAIVEGEHPGSSYYAAELENDIDEANAAAEELGLDFRFRAEGQGNCADTPASNDVTVKCAVTDSTPWQAGADHGASA